MRRRGPHGSDEYDREAEVERREAREIQAHELPLNHFVKTPAAAPEPKKQLACKCGHGGNYHPRWTYCICCACTAFEVQS